MISIFRSRRFFTSSSISNLLRTKSYVDGEWTDKARTTFKVYNPASGVVLSELPSMNADEVADVSEIAHYAWEKWRLRSCKERSAILSQMADLMKQHESELAEIITMENGKPFIEAKGEINYAISFLEYYSEEAKRMFGDVIPHNVKGRRLLSIKEPIGPVAIITPWNFPSAMITRKLGPALAAGCSVVIKPSEETPLSALALCAIAEAAGVPRGVVNCVTVGRENAPEVGKALSTSPWIRKVSFTGSTPVGKLLLSHASDSVKKCSMELGGNAPFIVFDDADIDIAISSLMIAKFRNAGQACIAANRILIQRNIIDEFTDKLLDKVKGLRCGDGMIKETTIGPIINKLGLDKVSNQVLDCIGDGAEILIGGSVARDLNDIGGNFYLPTILTNVHRNMAPFKEETFGPLAPLACFDTEEEAIDIANDTPYGLAAYACTNDLRRAWRVSEAIETGMVGINEGAISSELAPFGGVKESGLGREGSYQGMDEYCETKYLCFGIR
jgi:succinate-semialdehyde dehydrogenase / glutarate-semialdehyde dehydrogenase